METSSNPVLRVVTNNTIVHFRYYAPASISVHPSSSTSVQILSQRLAERTTTIQSAVHY
jgi:hypothetical protein